MTHGSLFSGIGGFDLAANWAGWENLFHCEINPFGQKVLKYYWPNAELFEDIKTTDFTKYANRIDVLTGGFPCQPYSVAGKRLGKEDDRHLWPEMLRAIREINPRYVVGENVSGIVSWNGGLVFNEVQTDLENEEYEVQTVILPACTVNAPHRRDRVWFIAYAKCKRREGREKTAIRGEKTGTSFGYGPTRITSNSELPGLERGDVLQKPIRFKQRNKETTSNADSGIGRKRGMYETEPEETERHTGTCNARNYGRETWDNFPTQSPVRGRNDGLSAGLVGITFPKHRNESIKGYGNAIVPQVAFQIFKTINEYEKL